MAASFALRWGDPSLAPCYPRLRQVAFGMYMPRFNADVQRPTPKEEASMNTTSTVTPISETPKQPQQRQPAKDIIAANVKSLREQQEAGHSDALTAYLDAMSRFHNYSFGNILEIARQRPTATRVAGLYAWNQLGRKVMKGQKGIRILAPIFGIERKKDEEANKDVTKQNTLVLVGFRNAYVFDVEQTEGAELPTLREMTGTVGENRDRLVSFIEAQGIELAFTEKIAPALGMSYGGRIAILPGQSEAEEFSTLVHELAHELLHKAERRTTTTKVVRETEAEAVAFVIGKAVRLETQRIRRLHPALPRQCCIVSRELGSHSADLRCHPCCLAAADSSRGRDTRCRTGEGGVMQTILHILKQAGGWHHGLYLKIKTRLTWRWSLRRPTNQAHADFPQSLSVTTANRMATSCATPRCLSSLDWQEGRT